MHNPRRNLWILFFTMVVTMLGFGMIIPIMPFYIKSLGASGSALGGLMATYGIMQFVFAPMWGGLSDRYGRKPILLVGVLGNALAQILFGLSTELWMLFAARALSGVLSAATLPTVMAYVGDSTSEKQRGGGMGIIGAAMGIGMVIGPGLGGWLAGPSLSLPFFIAGGLSLLALGLIFVLLPEPQRAPSTEPEPAAGRQFRGPQLGLMWQALTGPLGILFFLALLFTFGLTNFEAVFGLYGADRYGYDTRTVGMVLTLVGTIAAVVQGGLTGPATRRWGEERVVRVSLLSSAVGFLVMTQAHTFPQVLLAVGFYMVSNSMINPAVSAMISKRASGGQGITMGLTNSFLSLGRIIGPLWAGMVYDVDLNFPYLSGAVIMLAGFLITMAGLRIERPGAEVQVGD